MDHPSAAWPSSGMTPGGVDTIRGRKLVGSLGQGPVEETKMYQATAFLCVCKSEWGQSAHERDWYSPSCGEKDYCQEADQEPTPSLKSLFSLGDQLVNA